MAENVTTSAAEAPDPETPAVGLFDQLFLWLVYVGLVLYVLIGF